MDSIIWLALGLLAMLVVVMVVRRSATGQSVVETAAAGAGNARGAEDYLSRLSALEKRVVDSIVSGQTVAKNVCTTFHEQLTLGQRVADRVAQFGGSWTFLGLFGGGLLVWILWNVADARPFDPYPFILLNLILSCVAAAQGPIIMMSQNRQAAKDRHEAQQDYEINLKAEMEVMSLHAKLDEARVVQLQSLLDLQKRQMEILARLEQRLELLERNANPS